MDTEPRLVLGRYRLLHQLAVGGTARVFRARDEQLDRDVAVKLLHPHLLPDDTSRRRLEAEARAAAGLSHPGIATVYDVDTHPAAPAIVMELVDGEPLSARLVHGPMPAGAVARLGAELADALLHAHRRGIVHRDVKPGNILLERDTGRARLVDFGIAHSLAAGAESLTQTGTALGTPRYMSPEQMAGEPVGPRTDIWSLGAVMYQALTGSVPFDGPTPVAIAAQQRHGPPAMLGIDPALASIVMACLSVDVAHRPLDAAVLATALRDWQPGEGAAALAQTETAPVVVLPPPHDTDPHPPSTAPLAASPGRPERPLSRRAAVMAGVAGMAGLLLLAALLLPGVLAWLNRDAGVAASTPAPTSVATPTAVAQLQAAYLEACGEPLPPDALEGDDLEESIQEVNEEIADCLEEPRNEGEGRGGGPKDDGRGKGNGGNGNGKGRGNGGD